MGDVRRLVDQANVTKYGDSNEAKKNIHKLLGEAKRFQEKIKSSVDANYIDFIPSVSSNRLYLEEYDKIITEIDNVCQCIAMETKSDLYEATEDLRHCTDELNEIRIGIQTCYKLLSIDDIFQKLEAAKSNNEYLIIMDLIGKLKAVLNDDGDKVLSQLDSYQNIKIRYHIESEMLLHNLNKCFEQLVQFDDKQFQNTRAVSLRISKDECQMHEIIVALFNTRYNSRRICEFLLEKCFEPIVMKPVSVDFRDDKHFYHLSLSYSLKILGDYMRPNYKTVFKHIEMIILCLSHITVQNSEYPSVFKLFGKHLKEKLIDLVINECLEFSIPDTIDEMNESTLVPDILHFQQFLMDSQLLSIDDYQLSKYAEKIGIIFQKRFCANIFENAVEIMKKDLHDVTLTGANYSPADSSFRNYVISKSILELINLMENVLKQRLSVGEEISVDFQSAIPTIFDLYFTEVPSYHEKLLCTIPQQTALFHNNCMYLAHWVVKNSDSCPDSFQTIAKNLHHVGSEKFAQQIQNQRLQLLEILRDFDLSNVISELGIGQQKVVRQCMRQLDLLKNVWQTILSENVYNKTMLQLLNDFCSEVITRITAMEDITTNVGSELVHIIDIIEERAPTLFQDTKHVLQSKVWIKLTELKVILSSSLTQITNLWCEGKGTLTVNFTAEEIKHFIRALFQNTDRRANALASII